MVRMLLALGLLLTSAAQAQGPGPAPVIVAPVVALPFADRHRALGTVRAAESVRITSTVTERVATIHFQQGATVAAGDLLVRLEAAEEQAELRLSRARAEEAEAAWRRARDMADQNLLSAADLDSARANRDAARATVEVAAAAVAERELRAPFSGRVGLRMVSPGQYVSAGDAITQLDDLSALDVAVNLPVGKLSLLDGLQAQVLGAGEPLAGRLIAAASALDPSSQGLPLRLRLQAPSVALKPGQAVEVLLSGSPRKALAIPEAALFPQGGSQQVYRVVDGAAQRVTVRSGLRKDGMVEILDGLAVGNQVVVHGGQRLRPGAAVTITGVLDDDTSVSQLLDQAP